MAASEQQRQAMLGSRVHVPKHVVYRDFADETVILNLETGMYHGLNPTAAKMLESLDGGVPVGEAVDSLAAEFGQPRERVEQDVLALCEALGDRGLIAHDGGDPPD